MKNKLFALIALSIMLSPFISTTKVLAWHPVGVIQKQVQNVTSGGVLQDANDSSHAIASKPGDTLRYVIIVSNNGSVDQSGNNDMANVVLTDTLPKGVELSSDVTVRQITENLGTIKPQTNVTKEYTVKVTSVQDGELIVNKACFNGNSTINDNAQSGCDVADVLNKVPTVVITPISTTPVTPITASTPKVLPNTGPNNILAVGLGVSVLCYLGSMLLNTKRIR
jgi:uncharacterized repeat protein (TIGR01451 family)